MFTMLNYLREPEKCWKTCFEGQNRRKENPSKVEPKLRMIIGNFREGKEDEVPIWMEKGGKPFLVRYMAVRDKEQNYVGTLEAVTDMTEVKEHFRQYFKSHPEEL